MKSYRSICPPAQVPCEPSCVPPAEKRPQADCLRKRVTLRLDRAARLVAAFIAAAVCATPALAANNTGTTVPESLVAACFRAVSSLDRVVDTRERAAQPLTLQPGALFRLRPPSGQPDNSSHCTTQWMACQVRCTNKYGGAIGVDDPFRLRLCQDDCDVVYRLCRRMGSPGGGVIGS